VLLLVAGHTYAGADYPTGSNPFDVDLSYVSGGTTQPLGLDSQHDLVGEVPVGAAGIITVTITIQYTGFR
jgi:hypothetical protein